MHSEQFPGPDIKRSLCVYQPSPYGILSHLRQVFQIDYSFFFLYWACVFKILLEGVRFSPFFFFPLYLCCDQERSNSQKYGDFHHLIFRDFQLTFPMEEHCITPYFSELQTCLRAWGRLRGGR